VIVVLGRPAARLDGGTVRLAGAVSEIALALANATGRVELVGAIGNDDVGDALAVTLARHGVGHAALLRDSSAPTPVISGDAMRPRGPLPRLDARDVDLGLRYLVEVHLLVIADALDPDAEAVARELARYHGVPVVGMLPGDEPRDVVKRAMELTRG
jgi:sugar/nucleoside kinase (ribokinase family)